MDYGAMVTDAAAGLLADVGGVLALVVAIALGLIALFVAARLALRAFALIDGGDKYHNEDSEWYRRHRDDHLY